MRLHALHHDGTPADSGSFDLMVLPEAGNWLIQIPRIDRDWQAEMGYIGRTGRFVSIVASNRLSSPYTEPEPEPVAQPEPPTPELVAEIPEVAAIAPAAVVATPVSAPAIAGSAAGPDELIYETITSPVLPEGYAPAPYPVLETLPPPWPVLPPDPGALDEMPQPPLAGRSNAALEPSGASEWRLRPPEAEQPAPAVAPVPGGASEFGPQQAFAQPGSQPFGAPFGAGYRPAEAVGKDFWLWVKTELIIFGATEPDARVTLQGLPITLRSDGTFTARFALPDGEIELPVRAVNADGDLELQIKPIVTRRTEK
jgi:hypothetical protein